MKKKIFALIIFTICLFTLTGCVSDFSLAGREDVPVDIGEFSFDLDNNQYEDMYPYTGTETITYDEEKPMGLKSRSDDNIVYFTADDVTVGEVFVENEIAAVTITVKNVPILQYNTEYDVVFADGSFVYHYDGGTKEIGADSLNDELSFKTDTGTLIENDDPQGDTTAQVTSQTIAMPYYTVTIPTEIDFGTVNKTTENSADRYAYTGKNTVSVNHANLYENEMAVSVSIDENAGTLTSGTDTLAYDFVTKADTGDKTIDLTKPVITAVPTEKDNDVTESFDFYGKTDCSKIKVASTFTQTVKFTVAMTDKEA